MPDPNILEKVNLDNVEYLLKDNVSGYITEGLYLCRINITPPTPGGSDANYSVSFVDSNDTVKGLAEKYQSGVEVRFYYSPSSRSSGGSRSGQSSASMLFDIINSFSETENGETEYFIEADAILLGGGFLSDLSYGRPKLHLSEWYGSTSADYEEENYMTWVLERYLPTWLSFYASSVTSSSTSESVVVTINGGQVPFTEVNSTEFINDFTDLISVFNNTDNDIVWGQPGKNLYLNFSATLVSWSSPGLPLYALPLNSGLDRLETLTIPAYSRVYITTKGDVLGAGGGMVLRTWEYEADISA